MNTINTHMNGVIEDKIILSSAVGNTVEIDGKEFKLQGNGQWEGEKGYISQDILEEKIKKCIIFTETNKEYKTGDRVKVDGVTFTRLASNNWEGPKGYINEDTLMKKLKNKNTTSEELSEAISDDVVDTKVKITNTINLGKLQEYITLDSEYAKQTMGYNIKSNEIERNILSAEELSQIQDSVIQFLEKEKISSKEEFDKKLEDIKKRYRYAKQGYKNDTGNINKQGELFVVEKTLNELKNIKSKLSSIQNHFIYSRKKSENENKAFFKKEKITDWYDFEEKLEMLKKRERKLRLGELKKDPGNIRIKSDLLQVRTALQEFKEIKKLSPIKLKISKNNNTQSVSETNNPTTEKKDTTKTPNLETIPLSDTVKKGMLPNHNIPKSDISFSPEAEEQIKNISEELNNSYPAKETSNKDYSNGVTPTGMSNDFSDFGNSSIPLDTYNQDLKGRLRDGKYSRPMEYINDDETIDIPTPPEPPIPEPPKGPETDSIPELPNKITTLNLSLSENKDTLEKVAKKMAGERLTEELKRSNFIMKAFKRSFEKDRILKRYTKEAMEQLRNGMFADKVANATDRFTKQEETVSTVIGNDKAISNIVNLYINGSSSESDFQQSFESIIRTNHRDAIIEIKELGTNALLKIEPYRNFKAFLGKIQNETEATQIATVLEEYISNYENRRLLESELGFTINDTTKNQLIATLSDKQIVKTLQEKRFDINLEVREAGNAAYNLDYKKADKETGAFYKTGNFIAKHPYISAGLTSLGMAATTVTGPFAKVFGALGIGTLASAKTNKEITGNHKLIQERSTLGEYSQAEVLETISRLKQENETAGRWRRFWNNRAIAKQKLYLKTGNNRKELTKKEFDELKDDKKRVEVIINSKSSFYSPEEFSKVSENLGDNAEVKYFTFETRKGTLHRHVAPTSAMTNKINAFLNGNDERFDITTEAGRRSITHTLAQALSRIDAGNATGNSYLKSKNTANTEKELNELYKAVENGLQELGITRDELRNEAIYQRIYERLTADSDFAHKNFKNMRRKEMGKSAAIGAGAYATSSAVFGQLNEWLNPNTQTVTTSQQVQNPAYAQALANRTPIMTTEMDPGIKQDMMNLLGKHFSNLETNLQGVNGETYLWNQMVAEMNNNPQIGNQIKNDMLEFIFKAKENGISELVTQAQDTGIFDDFANNTPFSDTIMDRMSKWGYTISKADVANYLQQIDAGTLDPSTITPVETQRAIAEVLFNGVQRNDPNAGKQFFELFFDQVETGNYNPIDPNIPKTITQITTKTVTRDINFLDYVSALGIPVFRNKYVSPLKKETTENKEDEIISADYDEQIENTDTETEILTPTVPLIKTPQEEIQEEKKLKQKEYKNKPRITIS